MKIVFRYIFIAIVFALSTEVVSACNPEAGTLSVNKKYVCVDEWFDLTVSDYSFNYQSMNARWERKKNNESWVNISDGGEFPNFAFYESEKGTYKYRVTAYCINGSGSSTSNEIEVKVGDKPSKSCNNNNFVDLRQAVARVNIPGLNSPFTGFLINNTLNDGRLLFLTTAQPFNCYSPILSQATFTWNADANICSGAPTSATTTTGATLLLIDEHLALLELSGSLPLEKIVLLGWDLSIPTGLNSIFTNTNSSVLKGLASGGSSTTVSNKYNLYCSGDYETNITGKIAVEIEKWSVGGFEKVSRGAPLLKNGKAVGVHLASKNEFECDFGETLGGFLMHSSNAMFTYLSPNGATSAASISFVPCRDEVIVNSTLVIDTLVKASVRVVGLSKINNVVVRFQAGEEILLENGFDSGTNFIAEIVPCVPTIFVISPKPESDQFFAEHFKSVDVENTTTFFESDNAKINAFPTVLVDSKITIEITGIENVSCLLVNNQGKVLLAKDFRGNINGFTEYIDLPNIASGMYFLILKNEKDSETIKIIKQ